MANTITTNSNSGSVDYSKVEPGDTFTPDVADPAAVDSTNSKADVSLLDKSAESVPEEQMPPDGATEQNGMNFPSSARDRKTERGGRGMSMDEYGSSLQVMSQDSVNNTAASPGDAQQPSSAATATATATSEYESSGPFSGSGESGEPANKKLKYFA